jgi:hypothetical protein
LLYYQRYEKYLIKTNNMPIPKPTAAESQNEYVGRCMHEIASEYDTNEQAVAICINTYEKGNMSKSTEQRVAMKVAGVHLLSLAEDADEIVSKLAEEKKSYPWDECIADQTARYGDEETAKKVCGMIKSKYGS